MDKLFTAASFGTLATCTAAIVVLVNTTRHVFGWGPRWFALLVALIVAVASYVITSGAPFPATAEQPAWMTCLIVVMNGCLLYTSSFGIQNAVIGKRAGPAPGPASMNWHSMW